MVEVKILIEGYAKSMETGYVASSTTTLIKSNGKIIIADPGCNRTKLLQAMKKENLRSNDVDYIFQTHNHPDHVALAGIFENAKIVDELYVYDGDIIAKHGGIIPETDLKVIRTPGHLEDHCSLIVPTREGIYVVAGDVFAWLENEKQEIDVNKQDIDVEHTNMERMVASRKKILEIADFVIPGHGKMFKVEK